MRKLLKVFVILYLFFLTSLISAWAVFHVYQGDGKRFGPHISNFISFFVRIPGNVSQFVSSIMNGDIFMPPPGLLVKNHNLKDGFTIYDSSYKIPNGLNLLVSTYNTIDNSTVIKLIDLDQLNLKYKWVVADTSIQKNIFYNDLFLLEHPLIVGEKNIIAHNNRFLFKIDSNGGIVWKKDINVHHSIEIENENIVWVCGFSSNNNNYSFISKDRIPEDVIYKVNISDGRILFKKSIFDMLYENAYQYIITFGAFEKDLFHINDIQPALYSSPFWEKGDLLISLRNRNTVLLYRPSTDKIIWLKSGPWSNQHDCDFIGDSQILVFGNDVFRTGVYTLINGHNNAYIYDFRNGQTTVPYDQFFRSSNIGTETEGRCDMLTDGNLMVEETEKGRILFGDSSFIKMLYIQRYDKKNIQTFNWCRIVNDNEFINK